MATITDVAEEAGVSVKTVSRVMNDYPHISAKTRDKVQAAMETLNYAPSSIARQMRLGDTLSIGMLYGDPGSGYQSRLNHAVLQACSDARRYLAVGFFNENDPDWRGQMTRFLDRTKVRNLILVPPMCDSEELHELLREREINTVLISPTRQMVGVSAIAMDDRMAAKEVTTHLLSLGHRNIAHISGHLDHVASLLRRQGFEEAIHRSGLDGVRSRVIEANSFAFRDSVPVALELLSGGDRPTAIFAANDDIGAATISVAYRLGLRVPEDLSVAGFDNTAISRRTWPELTTVGQPFEAMAKKAVELLSGKVSADRAVSSTYVLPHALIVRESTGPAADAE